MRQAKGEEVVGSEDGCEPFVVSCEATKTGSPSEASFDDPSSGQQHEASFGLGVLYHLEPDAMLSPCLFGRLAGVALIDIGQLDVFAGYQLDLAGELADLSAVLLIGWGDAQREQMA